MPLFEFTLSNGTVSTGRFAHFADAFQGGQCPELVKIELIDARARQESIRNVNNSLHSLCSKYSTKSEFLANLEYILFANDFLMPELTLNGESGAIRCQPISQGAFLCVTWYKMPSGNYEFVAYIS